MRPSLALAAVLAACAACASSTSSPPPAGPDDLALPDGAVAATFVHSDYDAARHDATCKPWLRVFAGDGRQLTKDLGGVYPHHRGLFVGWNQVRCDNQRFDFWHCNRGETQRVVEFRGGGGAEPQVAEIDWCAKDGRAIVREVRRTAVRRLDEHAFVLEVACELRAAGADVQLGGDPQHAGCQFRALASFGEPGSAPVEYVRPPGAHEGKDDVWTGCAWVAARLPLPGGAVVVLRVEHPANPPATWSTRAYGRFGAMCTAKLTKDAPLRLRFAYVVDGSPVRCLTWGRSPTEQYGELAARAFAN